MGWNGGSAATVIGEEIVSTMEALAVKLTVE
jgi:hypothetical protein